MPLSTAFWCVLIAAVMPVFTVAIAKWGRGDFDNHEPRAWIEQQTGLRRRADYAHRNHFEAFPFFATAVLVATYLHAPQGRLDMLAMAFIACRVLFTLLYLSDHPTPRSLVWTLGYGCTIAIFLLPVWAH